MSESMEKRVLALKYRPHRFEDLVGQSTVSQTLSLALDSNRLSHAYLFSGLRGSGKTSTARIMAKALLCSNGPTSKPCEVCDNCVSANANRHLDIIEMDAASNRGIDDIKDLIEHTKYKPSSARFKVFIIDEVHMLTTQAFNALLKTLEEPPGFVKFILATTDPLKLPATILSRTQHFRFNKISSADVIHHLSHILNEENIDYETEALEILSRSGQGSLRDTLTMLDQAIIFSKGRVTTSAVVDMLGLIDPDVMDTIFQVVLNKGDITAIVKELENYEVSQVCDEMTIYLKHRMLDKDSRFDLLLFDRFFRILSDAKHLLAMNSDGGFVLILTLMKMIEAVDIKTIDEIINQVQKIQPKVEELPQTISKPEPVTAQTPEVQTSVVEEVKEEVQDAVSVEPVAPIEVVNHDINQVVEKVEESINSVAAQTPVQNEIKEEIPQTVEVTPSMQSNPFEQPAQNSQVQEEIEHETKIEEPTPADIAYANSVNIVDLGAIDAIETVSYPNPFDNVEPQASQNAPFEAPTQTQEEIKPEPTKDDIIKKVEESISSISQPQATAEVQAPTVQETAPVNTGMVYEDSNPFDTSSAPTVETPVQTPAPVQNETQVSSPANEVAQQEVQVQAFEQQVAVNPNMEVEAVPVEDDVQEPLRHELYDKLTEKVYDRDYSLGECFERNFIFNGYEDNKLSIISYAQGDDRKFLYKHFALIRTFAQDVFGNEVELDFTKEEPREDKKVVPAPTPATAPQEEPQQTEQMNNSNDSGSMIEDVEVGSGCVADMHKTANPSPSQQELQLNDLLNSKMLNKAKELFDVKKITVKSRS